MEYNFFKQVNRQYNDVVPNFCTFLRRVDNNKYGAFILRHKIFGLYFFIVASQFFYSTSLWRVWPEIHIYDCPLDIIYLLPPMNKTFHIATYVIELMT